MTVFARTYLLEWWEATVSSGEPTGRWFEHDSASVVRAQGLSVVKDAWTSRVRITMTGNGGAVAVDPDRHALLEWTVDEDVLPRHCEGLVLPPRSPDDIHREVVCGCRDALALGLRAGRLDRRRVLELLHEIDRSFDPGLLEERR